VQEDGKKNGGRKARRTWHLSPCFSVSSGAKLVIDRLSGFILSVLKERNEGIA